jgi:Tfp pilus assembly protein PilF
MSSANRSLGTPVAVAVCLVQLGLLGLGCATRQPDPELEKNQRRAESHYEMGMDHLSRRRPEMALRELLMADRLRPDHPPTQFALANAYLIKGRREEAEDYFLRALAIHRGYHEARVNLATMYLQEERWDDALEQLQVLIDDPTFPAPWLAYNNRGWALLSQGRAAEARRSLEKAHEYNPRYWPAMLNLGILEQQAGNHLEAAELFQRMLELQPDPNAEAEANYRLAQIYISLGKRDRAMDHLMTAVARTPDGEWGRKSEEYLKLLR